MSRRDFVWQMAPLYVHCDVQASAASTTVDRQRCRESILTTFMNWKTQKSAVILKTLTNLVELIGPLSSRTERC